MINVNSILETMQCYQSSCAKLWLVNYEQRDYCIDTTNSCSEWSQETQLYIYYSYFDFAMKGIPSNLRSLKWILILS